MTSGFDSFDESTLGVFVESPLRMRQGELPPSVVWASTLASVFKLSTTDFTEIAQAFVTIGDQYGIGGDAMVIWGAVDDGADEFVQEFSTSDLSPVLGRRSANLDAATNLGCGGDESVIRFSDNLETIWKLDPEDFSNDIPPTDGWWDDINGIGGDHSFAFFITYGFGFELMYMVTGGTYESWRFANFPGTLGGGRGIGGKSALSGGDGVVYISNYVDAEIWVYDGQMNYVSGPHATTQGGNLYGIGGS